MPALDYIECLILGSDGTSFVEYNPDPEPGKISTGTPTITRYIQAKDGEAFQLNFGVKQSFKWDSHGCNSIRFQASIDGVFADLDGLVTISSPSQSLSGSNEKSGPDGTWQFRKFIFSSIRITEDESEDPHSKEEVETLGEIKIIVRRVIFNDPLARVQGCTLHLSRLNYSGVGEYMYKDAVVHEKAIKDQDITYAVTYEEFTTTEAAQIKYNCAVHLLDSRETPFMIFRFLYRAEHALKSLGLIPRTPAPEPKPKNESLDQEDDLSSMNKEQMAEEIRRLRAYASRADVVGFKREKDSSLPAVRPKTEPGTSTDKRAKRAKRAANIEIIDLTEDD
ncbi:hypothetical protein RUND412_002786 [Rhizina undulata]